MAICMSGPGNAILCLPVAADASYRDGLNIKVIASCCEANLNETFATYCAFLMDNRVYVTQQRAVLKTLTKNFQREIRIYNEGTYASELCKDSLHLTENTN